MTDVDRPPSFRKAFPGVLVPALWTAACVATAVLILVSALGFAEVRLRGDLSAARAETAEARSEVAGFKSQAGCRSELNVAVNDASNRVRLVDGDISVTQAQLFQEALTGVISAERKAELADELKQLIGARQAEQANLDVAIDRQRHADTICP